MFCYLLIAFLSSVGPCPSPVLEMDNYQSNLILTMVPPPGGSISTERVDDSYQPDEIAKPGCTLNTIKRNLSDGSTEVTKTLKCTTIKIKNPVGKVIQKPAPGSGTSKSDLNTIENFRADSY